MTSTNTKRTDRFDTKKPNDMEVTPDLEIHGNYDAVTNTMTRNG